MAYPTPSKYNSAWLLGNMAQGTRKATPVCSTGFTHRRKPKPGTITKKLRAKKEPNKLLELNGLRPREPWPRLSKEWMVGPKN
eukprot:16441179-Heterocapsa_arctica.AAC.1